VKVIMGLVFVFFYMKAKNDVLLVAAEANVQIAKWCLIIAIVFFVLALYSMLAITLHN